MAHTPPSQQPSPSLSDLLRRSLASRLTGHLELREDDVRRRITLLEGFPVSARSNLLREHLLRFLLQHGHIDKATYTQFLGHVQDGRWKRGQTLVRSGLLAEKLLYDAELRLAQQIFLTCFGWKRASTHFQPVPRQQIAGLLLLPLDPFSLYEHWLTEHVSSWRLRQQLERFQDRALRWSTLGLEQQTKIAPLLARHPTLAEAATQGWLVQQIFAQRSSEEREPLACALLALFHLGALQIVRPSPSFSNHNPPSLMGLSLAGDLSTSPESSYSLSLDGPQDVLPIVSSELTRVQSARSSYEALGLSEGASQNDIQRAYDRFESFYGAPQFAEGDTPELRRLTALLRQALAQAHRELTEGILAHQSSSTWAVELEDLLQAQPSADTDATALAHILFDDGRAYLKLGEPEEARHHFQHASRLLPNAPRYKAYLGWAMFVCATEDDLDARNQAQTLLREAIAADPLLDDGYVLLGNLFCRNGRFDRGADMYRRALEINPHNKDAQQALQPIE